MGKSIRYSLHAETVIAQRKLSKDWMVAAMETPDWTEPGTLTSSAALKRLLNEPDGFCALPALKDQRKFV